MNGAWAPELLEAMPAWTFEGHLIAMAPCRAGSSISPTTVQSCPGMCSSIFCSPWDRTRSRARSWPWKLGETGLLCRIQSSQCCRIWSCQPTTRSAQVTFWCGACTPTWPQRLIAAQPTSPSCCSFQGWDPDGPCPGAGGRGHARSPVPLHRPSAVCLCARRQGSASVSCARSGL